MRTIRIGVGSGGCSIERLEPAIDLVRRGRLDYLVYECLSERTIVEAQQQKAVDPTKGYNSLLERRMRGILKEAYQHGVKIISNMGAANPRAAVEKILQIAQEKGLDGLKIALVEGDDITDRLDAYQDCPLWDREGKLADLKGVCCANAYLGAEGILDALDSGADVVITGRIADPSLFVAPLRHEFGFTVNDASMMGQAILLGHLMECCCQITGGYFFDVGKSDVGDLSDLGFPIAEIDDSGLFFVEKLPDTGGSVCVDICKEQALYEIGNPAAYITPDAIADFSNVHFEQIDLNRVRASGATSHGRPGSLKVNIGYSDCWVGVAEISYGGPTSLARAKKVAEAVTKRWKVIGISPVESNISYIGYDSLFGSKIASKLANQQTSEVRLRIAVRTRTQEEAVLLNNEVKCLYINGAAGSAGIEAKTYRQLSLENILVPRSEVPYSVEIIEV